MLQFVSPCGRYRFNSQKELASHIDHADNKSENDTQLKTNSLEHPPPLAQKLTEMRKTLANGLNHFIRQSLDECALRAQRPQTTSNQQIYVKTFALKCTNVKN